MIPFLKNSLVIIFLRKTSWCFQNFLTMGFYRKICNKCYWSNVYNSRHSLLKQSVILFLSLISLLFLSFFYLPTDPANSNRSSFHIRWINFMHGLKINMQNIFNIISNKVIQLSDSFINLLQVNFVKLEIIKLNSSLQI